MKDQAKWTPGPWEYRKEQDEQGYRRIFAPVVGYTVAIPMATSDDAHLIAAAPDLLRGCNAALAYLADPPSEFPENRQAAVEIIRAALQKAEGGKP